MFEQIPIEFHTGFFLGKIQKNKVKKSRAVE
jgi:hypothetical protein